MTRSSYAALLAMVVACTPSQPAEPKSDAAPTASRPPALPATTLATPTATASAPLPAVTFQRVSFELLDAKTRAVRHAIEVFADGRVVFTFGPAQIPSVARAPAAILARVDAWAKSGPAAATADAGASEFLVRVRVVAGQTREAVYGSEALPPAERELDRAVGALVNTPREALECAKWDGNGDFALTLSSQDFGVGPGPLARVTFKSDGAASRATAGGGLGAELVVAKTTTMTPAEIDAIRAALVAQDLGHYKAVFGGAGEGSNFRGVVLTTPGGTCGRAFTNQLPDEMKPLLDALATVSGRLASK